MQTDRAQRLGGRFALFCTGQGVSAIGDAAVPVALALAVYRLSHSAAALGVVLACSTAARVAALLLGGVYADNSPRWLIMATADGTRLLIEGLTGVLLITRLASLAWLLGLGIFYGIASGMFAPASSGLLPQLVAKDRLQRANAVLALAKNSAKIAGPLIAVLLISLWSIGWTFILDAASFGVDFVVLCALGKHLGSARHQHESPWKDLVEGARELRNRQWYLSNLAVHAVCNATWTAFYVLGPVVMSIASRNGSGWGAVTAAYAVGAVIGGFLALRLRPRQPLVATNWGIALSALALCALGFRWSLPVTAVATAASSAVLIYANTIWTTLAQQTLPMNAISRLMSFDWLVSQATVPLAYVLIGALGASFGTQSVLLTCAAVTFAPAAALAVVSATGRLTPSAEEEAVPLGQSVPR
jgi:MFS family permease